MKYESAILKRLIDTYGVVGNPRYISEIIKEFIVRGKECFPNLFTYQADWLAHIDEFGLNPTYTVSYTGQSIYAPNTLERPVKSAILRGNTLVNMCDDGVADASDIDRFTHNYAENGGTFEKVSDGIKATATVDNIFLIVGYDIRSQQKQTMAIGKKYYGVADVTVHKLTNSDSCEVIFRNLYGLRASTSLTNGRGLVQHIFTHNNVDGNYGWLAVGTSTQKAVVGDSFTVHSMSIYEITEEEVNLSYEELANKYPVKCVGMQSVKMPVLKTTGKNLCNINKYINAGIRSEINQTGSMIFSKQYRSYYIECKPSTTYTIRVENSNNRFGIGCSDIFSEDTEFTLNTYWMATSGDLTGQTLQRTITTTEKDKYLYVYVANNGVFNPDIRVQVEESSTATSYEPYKTNILTVNEPIELRGIGNVKDELDLLTGELTTRVGEYEINATTPKRDFNDTGEKTIFFYINQTHLLSMPKVNAPLISNSVIQPILDDLTILDVEGVHFTSKGHLHVRIDKSRLSGTSSNEVSDYLRENPITIQYQLETESIKTVDLNILDQNGQNVKQLMSFSGGTHINTGSLEGSLLPSISVTVETDLEETLKVCSLEGNTM